jgi:hypothetical protein
MGENRALVIVAHIGWCFALEFCGQRDLDAEAQAAVIALLGDGSGLWITRPAAGIQSVMRQSLRAGLVRKTCRFSGRILLRQPSAAGR